MPVPLRRVTAWRPGRARAALAALAALPGLACLALALSWLAAFRLEGGPSMLVEGAAIVGVSWMAARVSMFVRARRGPLSGGGTGSRLALLPPGARLAVAAAILVVAGTAISFLV